MRMFKCRFVGGPLDNREIMLQTKSRLVCHKQVVETLETPRKDLTLSKHNYILTSDNGKDQLTYTLTNS